MFRFTIRDVLWLTALVALALGWWASRFWSEAASYDPVPHRIQVRLGQNHFEAEGHADVLKEQFTMFLQAASPPPPQVPEITVAEGDMTVPTLNEP
jgi:hypothetical protein